MGPRDTNRANPSVLIRPSWAHAPSPPAASNDDSEDEDTTGANFAELTRIQAEAADVLKRARELAQKVDR